MSGGVTRSSPRPSPSWSWSVTLHALPTVRTRVSSAAAVRGACPVACELMPCPCPAVYLSRHIARWHCLMHANANLAQHEARGRISDLWPNVHIPLLQ
jgi:hypothetical protein